MRVCHTATPVLPNGHLVLWWKRKICSSWSIVWRRHIESGIHCLFNENNQQSNSQAVIHVRNQAKFNKPEKSCNKQNKGSLVRDGSRILWASIQDLSLACIPPSTPSTVIVLFFSKSLVFHRKVGRCFLMAEEVWSWCCLGGWNCGRVWAVRYGNKERFCSMREVAVGRWQDLSVFSNEFWA